MKKLKFFKCNNCNEVIIKLIDENQKLMCENSELKELIANSVEASQEKHMPVINKQDNIIEVSIGSVLHPMTEEHSINFIVLETNSGYKIANLTPQDKPETKFSLLENEIVLNVYEYCSLHGLWVLNVQ